MDIRSILNLIGPTVTPMTEMTERPKYSALLEAAWKLAYAYAYRSWYNPQSNTWVKVVGANNHCSMVMKNPQEFGMTAEDLQGATGVDRDPVILDAMCAKGWIRIAGQDRQNPNRGMIVEGASGTQMIKLLRMFNEDMDGKLMNFAMKVRGARANKEYLVQGNDEVQQALESGKLPAPTLTNRNDTLAGQDQAQQDHHD